MAEKQQPSALTGSAGLWSAVVLLAVAGIVGGLYVQNEADLHRADNLELQKNLEGQIAEARTGRTAITERVVSLESRSSELSTWDEALQGESQQLRTDLAAQAARTSAAEALMSERLTSLEALAGDVEQWRSDFTQLGQTLTSLRTERDQIADQTAAARDAMTNSLATLKGLSTDLEQWRSRFSQLEQTLVKLQTQDEQLKTGMTVQTAGIKAEQTAISDRLGAIESASREFVLWQQDFGQLAQSLTSLENMTSVLSAQVQGFTTQSEQLGADLKRQEAQSTKALEGVDTLSEKLAGSTNDLTELGQVLASAKAEREEMLANTNEARVLIETLSGDLERWRQDAVRLQNEVAAGQIERSQLRTDLEAQATNTKAVAETTAVRVTSLEGSTSALAEQIGELRATDENLTSDLAAQAAAAQSTAEAMAARMASLEARNLALMAEIGELRTADDKLAADLADEAVASRAARTAISDKVTGLGSQTQALAAADQKLAADLADEAVASRAARTAISEKVAMLESDSSYLLAQNKILMAEREVLAEWVRATRHIDSPRDNTDK